MVAAPPTLCTETLAFALNADPVINVLDKMPRSGPMILRDVSRLRPSLLLAAYELLGRSLEILHKLRTTTPGCRVVVLSGFPGEGRLSLAKEAGADGFLLKDTSFSELVIALKSVSRGIGPVFPQSSEDAGGPRVQDLRLEQDWMRLNASPAREKEILRLLNRGKSIAQVADILNIAPKTVRNRISGMLRKVGCRSQNELLARARACGFSA